MNPRTKSGNRNQRITTILALLFICVTAITCTGYAENLKSINSTSYGTESDNLDMAGRILKVEKWTNTEYKHLDNHLFEPFILTIQPLVNADYCDEPRKFYIKKGVDTDAIRKDNILEFIMNKNSCHKDKKLVILQINNWRQEEK
jgi:hypothetical protein